VSASKNRPRWDELPGYVRRLVEGVIDGQVVAAENCPGGFSPGFASRLTLADGRRAFAKAVDGDAWPSQLMMYRDEARVAAQLPPGIPAPCFLGSMDDGRWVVLAFECVDGREPARPWSHADLGRVVAAVGAMTAALTPSPIVVPRDQPRIGGWAMLAHDGLLAARLAGFSSWAADHLSLLAELEDVGLAAARAGDSLVHFDALPHNVLLTADSVLFVDWPHARLGAPCIDMVMVLASAAADGIDPEPVLATQPLASQAAPRQLTAVLAALTGFWLAGAVEDVPPGLEPIVAAKRALARGGLGWLRQRLSEPVEDPEPRRDGRVQLDCDDEPDARVGAG